MRSAPFLQALAVAGLLLAPLACKQTGSRSAKNHTVIQNTGSDTMVNAAQAWAEEYSALHPDVSVEVSGGGSGTGIAALINGTVDIANCSRKVEPVESQKAKANTGRDPVELVVGYDAMGIFVHKDNPLPSISLEQLAEIYGERGSITRWSQLGIQMPEGADEIILIGRQSNSGTYHYFRETVLGKKRDFKLGSRDMHGSKDVVELVTKTPGAISYSGIGYAMPGARMVPVVLRPGTPPVAPSAETTLDGSYPIARPLFMYTLGHPQGPIKDYLDWILGEQGQAMLARSGYIPLPKRK
ncbi:MAG TPA: phosphate ABC transporter substrate-binding protein [Holophaga sp.]|nr:phosphate ABC transporter substrate-binding protein [Holophaga sp.]